MNTESTKTLVGTLDRCPELHYVRSGVVNTTFAVKVPGIGVTDVVTSGDLAKNVALSLTAGDEVIVSGRWGNGGVGGTLIATAVGASLGSATANVQRYGDR